MVYSIRVNRHRKAGGSRIATCGERREKDKGIWRLQTNRGGKASLEFKAEKENHLG